MKAGVSIDPCAVVMRPARALVAQSLLIFSNLNWLFISLAILPAQFKTRKPPPCMLQSAVQSGTVGFIPNPSMMETEAKLTGLCSGEKSGGQLVNPVRVRSSALRRKFVN